MRKFILLLALGLCAGCETPSMEQRIEFAQKKFNTSEVTQISTASIELLVRDQSNQVWRVSINDHLEVRSAVIIFPAEKGKPPTFVKKPEVPVEPNFDVQ